MMVFLRCLVCFLVLNCVSCAVNADADIDAEALRHRFQILQKSYNDKRSLGYDLREVEVMFDDLRLARDTEKWQRFSSLLDEVELRLSHSYLPGQEPPVQQVREPDEIYPYSRGGDIHSFGFGIEFARPGFAQAFREIGIKWVRIGQIPWEKIERRAPRNGKHMYNWRVLDMLVKEYQSAGFEHLQFNLSPRCKWALKRRTKGPESAGPLKDEHLVSFERFMIAIVERYDGDGQDDMPGLRYPVLHFAAGSEMHHDLYWQGTVEEYGELLKIAYKAAKTANPNCYVTLTGMNFADICDNSPEIANFETTTAGLTKWFRGQMEFIKTVLGYHEYFDMVDFHYNYDYKGGYGVANWLRETMKEYGYEKPIIAGDMASAPMFDSLLEYRFNKSEGDDLYKIIDNPDNPQNKEKAEWFEREQALNVVKKLVVAIDLDLRVANVAQMKDWHDYHGGRNWKYQGLRRDDDSLRPAYHTYTFLLKSLHPYHSLIRLNTPVNQFVFRLKGQPHDAYIVWCDKGTEEISLNCNSEKVSVTPLLNNDGKVPEVSYLTTMDGKAQIKLTDVPILVEAIQSSGVE